MHIYMIHGLGLTLCEDMAVIRSPHKPKNGGARKVRHGVVHSELGQSSTRKLSTQAHRKKILCRRKVVPDGGYGHSRDRGSFSTISDPDVRASSTEEDSFDGGEPIRCLCGSVEDGGTLMVQWYNTLRSLGSSLWTLTTWDLL